MAISERRIQQFSHSYHPQTIESTQSPNETHECNKQKINCLTTTYE